MKTALLLLSAVAIAIGGASSGPISAEELTRFSPFQCVFHAVTGMPCFACGLTRAVVLAVFGRFDASLKAHLLGLPFLAIISMVVFARIFGHFRRGALSSAAVAQRHERV